MRRTVSTGLIIIAFFIAAVARVEGAANGAKIAEIAWSRSNIDTLHSFNADDVFEFVNQRRDDPNYDVIVTSHSDDSRSIEGFTWADLAGDDKYQLVVVFMPAGTSITNIAVIYRRSSLAKITTEIISGDGIGLNGDPAIDAPKLIQDLDGDGKYELVVPEEWGSALATSQVIFLKVYRLSNGSYVEASRDFPKFYDTQVLPQLETEISKTEHEPPHNGPVPPELTAPEQIEEWRNEPARNLALLEMKHDKILRVLGRDPNAGEKTAREWVKSGDWDLIIDATSVFEDIGGHQADLRAAKLARKRLHEQDTREAAH
jgi:hypothetical protein